MVATQKPSKAIPTFLCFSTWSSLLKKQQTKIKGQVSTSSGFYVRWSLTHQTQSCLEAHPAQSVLINGNFHLGVKVHGTHSSPGFQDQPPDQWFPNLFDWWIPWPIGHGFPLGLQSYTHCILYTLYRMAGFFKDFVAPGWFPRLPWSQDSVWEPLLKLKMSTQATQMSRFTMRLWYQRTCSTTSLIWSNNGRRAPQPQPLFAVTTMMHGGTWYRQRRRHQKTLSHWHGPAWQWPILVHGLRHGIKFP